MQVHCPDPMASFQKRPTFSFRFSENGKLFSVSFSQKNFEQTQRKLDAVELCLWSSLDPEIQDQGTASRRIKLYSFKSLRHSLALELLLFICPFISSFFFLSNFQTFKIFVTLFSDSETVWPRRLKLDTHMNSEQMYRVYRNQFAAAYSSFYFSFSFLSNFQTLNFFVKLFSGTVRPWWLKLGAHVDSGQMYCVYRNQAAAAYLSRCFFIFFLSIFIFSVSLIFSSWYVFLLR